MTDLLTIKELNFNKNDLGQKIGTKTNSIYVCDVGSFASGVFLSVTSVNTFDFKNQLYTIISDKNHNDFLVTNEFSGNGNHLIYQTRPFQNSSGQLSSLSPKVGYFVIDKNQGIVSSRGQFAQNSMAHNNFIGQNHEKLIKNAPKLIEKEKQLYSNYSLFSFTLMNPDYTLVTRKIDESATELPSDKNSCIEFIVKKYGR